jgi:hypothetical protein
MPFERWTAERANAWYERQPWLVGCNFIPSTASNQLEMWQAETFDPQAIDRELGWAEGVGFNAMRVFLHDQLWGVAGFSKRMDEYLAIAGGHGIRTMFVLFDDCWHAGAKLGPQPDPVPDRHNSRWLQAPGHDVVADESQGPRLKTYVQGVVGTFAGDERVLCWDIYNELTNGFLLDIRDRGAAEELRNERRPYHERLLRDAFEWAREGGPAQPLSAGAWLPDRDLNALVTGLSDVITFHSYENAESVSALIGRLRRHDRPIICTEYMARHRDSTFEKLLPVFQREHVGCLNWGLVNGRTQTHLPWDPRDAQKRPGLWFHDIFRSDGTPYDEREIETIRTATGIGSRTIDA